MHTPVRILLTGLVLIISSLTNLSGLNTGERNGSSSPYSGTENLKGLTDSVTVYWDERGMPHIYACNEHDLYMATGYVTARERLWQMDLVRRSASGRLAEIFGKSFLQADIFSRCLRIRENAELIVAKQDPRILACLQAYTDGVNAWISSCGKHLPVEFRLLSYKPEQWCLTDVASIIGLLGWNLDCRNLTAELFVYQLINRVGLEMASDLIPDWKATDAVVYPDFEINDTILAGIGDMVSSFNRISGLGVSTFSSSNSWAVSGRRSETGMPLLSNDIHLSLPSPGVWLQMHQVIPGVLNVTGVLIPGEPFIIAGHNASIAWGMTNLRVDAVDLFAETLNPDNPDLYLFNGEWREMTKKREIIRIRGGKNDTVTLRYTHRGPVISGCMDIGHLSPKLQWLGYDYLEGLRDQEKSAISMKWTGYDESNEVSAVWLINRAEDWDDLRRGLSMFRSISQNAIYADTGGNIGMCSGGGIPVRSGSAVMIRSGETGEHDWKGYLPFEEMPYTYNPPTGEVSSANNKTIGEDYPFFVSNSFEMPYRINRIREMLDEKDTLGMADFCRMVTDQHSDLAKLMTPVILSIRGQPDLLSPSAISLLDTLAAWDYEMSPSLIAPTLLEFFRISFRHNLLADELGDLYDRIWDISSQYYIYRILTEGPDEWVDDITTEAKETLEEIVRRSFTDAIASIEKKYGTNPEHWQWGRIHTVTFIPPLGSVRILGILWSLNSRKYPVGGSDHTVCPYFTYKPDFDAVNGASVRLIYNTADWDESLSVIPGGNSGVPSSEFYLSQADAFVEGRFYKDHFSTEAVLSSAKYTMTLKPLSPTPP